MDVSIIIVNYKTPELVRDCIYSILNKTKDVLYEIIIVDNASGDHSETLLKSEFGQRITYIQSRENLGFGKANNLGSKMALGKYLFFLNSDTLLKNNAIKMLQDYLETHMDVGICGGNLYDRDNKPTGSYCLEFDSIRSERKKSEWYSIIGDILNKRKISKMQEHEKIRTILKSNFNFSNQPIAVSYIYGADMMMSKKLFDSIHGFDPDFFMYAEEEELSWRVQQKGLKATCIPNAEIIHFDGSSFQANNTFNKTQNIMRHTGRMTYFYKRYGTSGSLSYYKYRRTYLKRILFLATIFHRTELHELTSKQLECLESAYQRFVFK